MFHVSAMLSCLCSSLITAYFVCVVEIQNPTPVLVNLFVALVRPAHHKRGIHVNIVTGKVQGDQALEDNSPSREGRRQKDQKAGGRASIRHHVEDGAEARALLVVSRGITVKSVEKAGDAVENGASSRMEGHVIE